MYDIFEKLLRLNNCKASDVAKQTGIPRSTFSDWKSGRAQPGAAKLQRIAEFFGVSVEYLMTGRAADQSSNGVMALSDEEQLLLAAFRQLNGAGQAKALELVKLLLMDPANKPQKDVTARPWRQPRRSRLNIYIRTYQLKS